VLTWVSDSIETHTGEPAARRVGRPLHDKMRPADDPAQRASWDAAVAARAHRLAYRDAIALADTARGPLHVAISGDPVFDASGRFTATAARRATSAPRWRARPPSGAHARRCSTRSSASAPT
jgi:hypothetical protein